MIGLLGIIGAAGAIGTVKASGVLQKKPGTVGACCDTCAKTGGSCKQKLNPNGLPPNWEVNEPNPVRDCCAECRAGSGCTCSFDTDIGGGVASPNPAKPCCAACAKSGKVGGCGACVDMNGNCGFQAPQQEPQTPQTALQRSISLAGPQGLGATPTPPSNTTTYVVVGIAALALGTLGAILYKRHAT